MAFRPVATLDDLWGGEMIGVEVRGAKVLLINRGGVVHAYEDRCPHLGLPLSQGRLERDALTCGGHLWQFDPCTGKGLNPMAVRLVPVPVAIERGRILVDVERLNEPGPCDSKVPHADDSGATGGSRP